MKLFTEGHLQTYERMMQDVGRHHSREKPEPTIEKAFAVEKKPVKTISVKRG